MIGKKSRLEVVFIKAFDLSDAWYQCLERIMEVGHEYKIDRGSYEGQRRKEFDFVIIQITNPSNRPLVPVIPEGLGLPPPTSMDYIEKYMEYLITDYKKPDEDYTYGERLVNAKVKLNLEIEGRNISGEFPYSFNQIDKAIEILKAAPGTNQALLQVGQCSDMGLNDPPCLRQVDLRVRYSKLHFFPYFRSWDLVGGFPSNLAALQLLKEYMAKEIGVEDGEIIAQSKGLHVYEQCWDYAKIRTYKFKKV